MEHKLADATPNASTGAFPEAGDKSKEVNSFGGASGGVMQAHFEGDGSSGTEIFGGQFNEEYLTELRGQHAAKIYDRMRRSETQVAMLLNAAVNPIKSANWDVESVDPTSDEENHIADLVKVCLMEKNNFKQFVSEACTLIPFGFSVFEVVNNVILNDPQFGNYNGIAKLAFRAQKTILEWVLEKKTGKIIALKQQVISDIGNDATIDGRFVVVFTLNKEGDNYEGISALRPMYGAYKRKGLVLKLMAIGLEKYAVGVPIGTIPKDKANAKKEIEEFQKVLQSFSSHEKSFLTKPEGWDIEVIQNTFDVDKVVKALDFENKEMINVMVANFLALGTGGNGGAYSLSADLSSFFLGVLQAFADIIAEGMNDKVIKDLVDLNFGPRQKYPKLKCTGINDKAGKDFADVVQKLTQSGNIKADDTLEEFLRKQYKMPQADKDTARAIPSAGPQYPQAAPKFSERSVKLADGYKTQWNDAKADLKEFMQTSLRENADAWREKLTRACKAATPAERFKVVQDNPMSGINAYKAELLNKLSAIALMGIDQARKEVPTKKKVKLVERIEAMAFDDYDPYKRLPATLQKFIKQQAVLIAETQYYDIEKAVGFQYSSSVNTTDDVDVIMHDVFVKVNNAIDGATGSGSNIDAAAGNAVANAVQSGRNTFFFEPEVLDEVESFTFYNEDPVSDICQDLNGQTFAANDPEAQRYFPPLHHNCKSRLVPNLKGAKNNPDLTEGGLAPTTKDLEKQITLCEHDHSGSFKLFSA